MVNFVCGGTLYQDIPSQYESEVEVLHRDPEAAYFSYHNITISDPGSRIAQAMGEGGWGFVLRCVGGS